MATIQVDLARQSDGNHRVVVTINDRESIHLGADHARKVAAALLAAAEMFERDDRVMPREMLQ